MLPCVALWLALITLSCCGHVAGHEKEELTTTFSDGHTTVTLMSEYEYDYNYTTDYSYYSYYPEAEPYIPDKASWTGQMNLVFLLGLVLYQIWT